MVKRAAAGCLMSVLLLIGACSPAAPAATGTPSRVPATSTPADTATPAPTITPLTRATLPPTWTPEATEATQAVFPTQTVDPRFEAMHVAPPPPEICGKFGADPTRNQKTLALGSPLQIYWGPAKDVSIYEVSVYGPDGGVVGVQRTTDTSLTLRPSLFTVPEAPYAWLVIPYDASGAPICLPRGMEIRTTRS